MKYSVIETISRTQKVIFVSFQSVLLIGMTLLSQASGDEAAAVYLNQLEQEYNGTPKFPNISTDPPGLAVDIAITPRSQSETVFQTIPAVLLPSYASYGINGTPNKALGDEVNLEEPRTKNQEPRTKNQEPRTKHQAPSTKHQAPGTRNKEPSTAFKFSLLGRASLTLFGVMLIAVLIEGAQALLPVSFSRGYAWEDLGASLVGGSLGIVLALRRGG